jgi:hypothetical protein
MSQYVSKIYTMGVGFGGKIYKVEYALVYIMDHDYQMRLGGYWVRENRVMNRGGDCPDPTGEWKLVPWSRVREEVRIDLIGRLPGNDEGWGERLEDPENYPPEDYER